MKEYEETSPRCSGSTSRHAREPMESTTMLRPADAG